MPQDGDINDSQYYAKEFSALSISESRYLAFRDVPQLVKQYVKGTKTLDYGCGSGQSPLFLKSIGLDVEGMDVNEHMISSAKQRDPAGTYEVIKSGQIPRKDGTYDFVFSSWVLVHAATKEELCKIVKEIARVFKKGGTFVAVVSSEDTYNNEWLSADTRFDENLNLHSGKQVKFMFKEGSFVINAYYWTTEDYKEAFTKAGLKFVRLHKPYGTDSDGFPWINEKEKAYVDVLIAQKE